MRTIKIRIDDKVFKHFMWFLQRFKKDEIQVINEDDTYLSVKEYLSGELDSLEQGEAEFISIEELDIELENAISKHEA
ncbi:MAG: hypothetical protein LC670_09795 [Flavobacteriales bacterium]|nr:hypothetical protein [Flavobacteriales bacterium]